MNEPGSTDREPEVRIRALAQELVTRLTARGLRVALAESCTGGWCAKAITDVPGSSTVFDCGYVTYSNQAKTDMLDVPPAVLEANGAVSDATVRAMAEGALEKSKADFAAAVSGIAGPAGGTPYKPVGTVWLCWVGRDGETATELRRFDGDRIDVRAQSVICMLQGLVDRVG